MNGPFAPFLHIFWRYVLVTSTLSNVAHHGTGFCAVIFIMRGPALSHIAQISTTILLGSIINGSMPPTFFSGSYSWFRFAWCMPRRGRGMGIPKLIFPYTLVLPPL